MLLWINSMLTIPRFARYLDSYTVMIMRLIDVVIYVCIVHHLPEKSK